MTAADAVLDQVFDQICGKAQAVIEEKNLLYFRGGQGFAQILFCNIKKLDNILVLFQFFYTVRRKRCGFGRYCLL